MLIVDQEKVLEGVRFVVIVTIKRLLRSVVLLETCRLGSAT